VSCPAHLTLSGNALLAALPQAALTGLQFSHLALPQGEVCFDAGDLIQRVYFPTTTTPLVPLRWPNDGRRALFRTNARLVLIMLRKARHLRPMRLGPCVFEVDQNGRPTTRVELPSGKSRGCVLPIRAFLARRSFDPKAINAMSLAFGDACDALGLHPTAKDPATA
jgi:hypothetical protein